MSVHVGKTIKELISMAEEIGVEYTASGKNGRLKKEDLIYPIRDYWLVRRYGSLDNIPWHMKMMLMIKSPMLAMRIDGLKQEQQDEIWNSNDWYFEEKLNGARMLILMKNGEYHIYSRHNSDVDFLPIEYTNKILLPDGVSLKSLKGLIMLDCELTSDTHRLNTIIGKYGVVTETQLQAVSALINSDVKRALMIQKNEGIRLRFNIFDCLVDGDWITNLPLIDRRPHTISLLKQLTELGFNAVPVRSNRSNKKEFYKKIILTGGEGVVAKNIYSTYNADTNRKTDGWIKIKRSMSEMAQEDDYGDTIDGWISGFELGTEGKGLENMVSTICVSTFISKSDGTEYEHEIARISGLDMKLLNDMTEIVGGVPTLRASYYGRVVEIDGAGVSARNKRLNHAVLVQFRYDKSKYQCKIDEDFLKKMIL